MSSPASSFLRSFVPIVLSLVSLPLLLLLLPPLPVHGSITAADADGVVLMMMTR